MLIGIAGKMGTGKTTFANKLFIFLSTYYPSDVGVFNFGDALKYEVADEFGIPVLDLYDVLAKNEMHCLDRYEDLFRQRCLTNREVLQYYGNYCRSIDFDYWVKKVNERMEMCNCNINIIGDVRYKNEADFIRSKGGMLIRLEPYPGWDFYSDHISETDLDDYKDFSIVIRPEYGGLEKYAYGVSKIILYSKKQKEF